MVQVLLQWQASSNNFKACHAVTIHIHFFVKSIATSFFKANNISRALQNVVLTTPMELSKFTTSKRYLLSIQRRIFEAFKSLWIVPVSCNCIIDLAISSIINSKYTVFPFHWYGNGTPWLFFSSTKWSMSLCKSRHHYSIKNANRPSSNMIPIDIHY